jgi:PAS domain S-box-containing protein/putative nucleotidyltransferase with HDIG domain
MSDALKKLQHELQATRIKLAEAEARYIRQEAEHQTVTQEFQSTSKKIELAHQEWMVALDVVDDPVFLHDIQFRILRCNKAYQRCAGKPFHEIIGQPYYEIFPKAVAPSAGCLRTMEKAGTAVDEEEVVVGEAIYRSRTYSVYGKQGDFLHSVHILEDITERKLMDDALRKSKDLLHSIVENTPARVFWKDKNLRYLGCNTQFAHDAGYSSSDELIGKTDLEMVWKAQAQLYRADDNKVMESGKPKLGFEEPQTTPDGNTIWLSTSKVPLRDENDQVIGILGIYQDITTRKHAEDKLRDSESFIKTILDNLPVGIAVNSVEPSVNFSYVNDNFSKLYRTTREKLNNPDAFWDVVYENPEFRQKIRERIVQDCASGDVERMHWDDIPITRNGEEISFISARNIPVPDKPLMISMVWDVTERKQQELSLLRVNRALKTLSAGNLALVQAENEGELLRSVTNVIVQTGGYRMAWVGYAEDDVAKTIRPIAQSGFEEGYLDKIKITWDDTELGQGPTGTAFRTKATNINQDCLNNPKMAPWREEAVKRSYQSSIAIPLLFDKELLGVLTIYAADPFSFKDDEVRLLEELASDLAYGIVTLRTRKEHEQHLIILREGLEQSIQTIANTVEARDPYTAGHQQRVSELAVAIAREMHLPAEQINGIHLAAIIHDLGKIHVPAEILAKPGRLSEIEYALIKQHPQEGYEILKDVKFPWPIADIVLQHHERMDGSGYPQGLKGDAILLEARIMAVADVVEAMSSHRPYRPGLGIDAALNEIEKNKGALYDVKVVDACLKIFNEGLFKF